MKVKLLPSLMSASQIGYSICDRAGHEWAGLRHLEDGDLISPDMAEFRLRAPRSSAVVLQ